MLIECSECKKQISDKAECCPHCGCPIKLINTDYYCNINGTKYNLAEIIDILPRIGYSDDEVHPYYIIGMIRDRTPLDPETSELLANIIIETKQIPKEFNGTIEIKLQPSNTPKCPKCGSTQIQMVTRKWSLLTGFMTNKVDRVCVNCKHKF